MVIDQSSGRVISSFLQSFYQAPDLAFQVLNSIPASIVTLDKTCQDITYNKKAAQFLRLQPRETFSDSSDLPFKMYHKGREIPTDEMPVQYAAYHGEEVKDLEIEFVWGDGVHKTAVCSSTPLFGEDGSILGAAAFFEDITEQRRIEDELKKSEEKFREIVKYVPEGVYEIDFHGPRLKSVSDTMCLLSGYTREELLSMNVFDILEEKSRTVFQERIRKQLGGEKIDNNVEYDIRAKDGLMLHALLNVTFTYKDGKPEGALVIAHEITERKRAEQALKKTEQELIEAGLRAQHNQFILETVIQQMPAGIIITDASGKEVKNNKEMDNIWKRTMAPSENIKSHGYTAFHPDGREYQLGEWPLLRSLEKGEEVIGEQMIILRGDGTKGTVLVSSVPVRDENGRIIAGVVIDVDITEQKQMEEELKESRNKYQALVETTCDFIWEMDIFGRYTYCSPQMETLWGIKPEEMIGKTPFDVMPEDEKKSAAQYFKGLANSPGPFSIESIAYDGKGRLIYLEFNGVPYFDDNGGLLGFRGITRDITQRKQAEEQLTRKNTLVEGINRLLHECLTNINEEELGKSCLDAAEQLTESRFGFIGEINPAGYFDNITISDPGWTACSMPAGTGERNLPKGLKIHGICERVLREGKSLFTNNLTAHPDSIELPEGHPLLKAFLGAPLTYNGKIIGMIGLANREGGYREEDLDVIEALAHMIVQTIMHKRAVTALHESEKQLEALVEKRTQELHELNKELRQITDNMADVILKVDTKGNAQYISPSYPKLMGYTVEDKLGKSVFDTLHPDDTERILFAFKYGMEAGIKEGRFEYRCRSADGNYLWLEATGKALFDDKGKCEGAVFGIRDITNRKLMEDNLRQSEERFFKAFNLSPAMTVIRGLDGKCIDINETCLTTLGYTREEVIGSFLDEFNFYGGTGPPPELKQAISEKKSIKNLEVELYTKQGEKRTGLLSGEFIDLYGEPCVIFSVNDITDLRMMEKEIAHLDRLNLVGEMAGGIAHEIRNPMMVVRGYLEHIGRKKEFEKYADRFQLMIGELDRANSIITEYLTLSRNKAHDAKTENINNILNDLISLIETDAIKDDKYVTLELEEIPDLLLEKNDIKQLVLNLVRNGLEAMDPGGYLTLKTFTDGHEIVLAVNDQGKGIPPEHMNKMGIPFFTTKDYGTGLGLAVSYKIAARHNAAISIETCPKGTTFFVKFKVPGESEI